MQLLLRYRCCRTNVIDTPNLSHLTRALHYSFYSKQVVKHSTGTVQPEQRGVALQCTHRQAHTTIDRKRWTHWRATQLYAVRRAWGHKNTRTRCSSRRNVSHHRRWTRSECDRGERFRSFELLLSDLLRAGGTRRRIQMAAVAAVHLLSVP